jgi:hypothetical protein
MEEKAASALIGLGVPDLVRICLAIFRLIQPTGSIRSYAILGGLHHLSFPKIPSGLDSQAQKARQVRGGKALLVGYANQ